MILIDQNETPDIDHLLAQSTEIQRGAYNQSPNSSLIFPDYTLINGGKTVGVNGKQVGEVIGNIDQLEEQIQRELRGPIDYLVLCVRGYATPDVGGNGYWSWSFTEKTAHRSHHTGQSYKGLVAFYNRLEELGIAVWQEPNLHAFALRLLALHDSLAKEPWEHKTLKRLIKADYYISETEEARRDHMLNLMSLRGANLGEELADAFTSWQEEVAPGELNLWRLMEALSVGEPEKWPLRNGKRVIGPAAVARLKGVLGV